MARTSTLINKAEKIKADIFFIQTNGGDEIDGHALSKAYDAIVEFIKEAKNDH